jgi:hydroxypyruvate reductase
MPAVEIFTLDPLPKDLDDELDATYRTHRRAALDGPTEALAGVRGFLTNFTAGAGIDILERLPALEIISVDSVGVDCIDFEYAKKRGLRVTNTPDLVTADTADLAIALMLAVSRRMVFNDRYVREGRWLKSAAPFGHSVSGAKVGIVGLGRIGRAIALRCAPMVKEIAYYGRTQHAGAPYKYFGQLEALAADSDILIVAADGRARGLISASVIEALGPRGVLINISRGPVIDEAAMVAALVEGRLGGAGLDVFANEPSVPPALFALENVVLQPHIGTATYETRHAMGRLAMDNLAAHFAGKPLLTPVL